MAEPERRARRAPARKRLRAGIAPPSAAKSKPQGQWHHGDLRAALIAWGTHLLDTQDIGALSLRAAARLAGVSQGAPAHHFTDLNGFYAAVAAQSFNDMVELRQQRLDQLAQDDLTGRLRAVIVAYVEFARAHPARFHLMFGPHIKRPGDYPDLLEAGTRSFQLLRSAVAPFQRSGSNALTEAQLAFSIWSATHGLASLLVGGRRAPVEARERWGDQQAIHVVVEFCIAALVQQG